MTFNRYMARPGAPLPHRAWPYHGERCALCVEEAELDRVSLKEAIGYAVLGVSMVAFLWLLLVLG